VPVAEPSELSKLLAAAQKVRSGAVKSTPEGEGKVVFKVDEFSFLIAAPK